MMIPVYGPHWRQCVDRCREQVRQNRGASYIKINVPVLEGFNKDGIPIFGLEPMMESTLVTIFDRTYKASKMERHIASIHDQKRSKIQVAPWNRKRLKITALNKKARRGFH